MQLTNASRLVLGKAWRTLAGEAPNGVDTEELTVVLLGRALVQIYDRENQVKNRDKMSLKVVLSNLTQTNYIMNAASGSKHM